VSVDPGVEDLLRPLALDQQRAASASRRREELLAARTPPDERHAPAADDPAPETDDALTLLVLCCHPSLTPSAQIALTLRAVGGLSTAEIAAAFLVRSRRWPSGSVGPSSASGPTGPASRRRRRISGRSG
jgi:predicted RNA polymerase sigma factor